MAFKLGMMVDCRCMAYAHAHSNDLDLYARSQWVRRGKKYALNYLDI